ncbi:sugar ABC transporter substrate-binding protein [Paenibacillus qinlingensis]|uniref:Multiple sugar transport system substrate-binding protein n=1 Tax=Paenibacillus qinlingensis TaxID=1837343 RepID=A0ABU1P6S0_9BACL|nr:sugar ABC transporter substrate-binding protein [Paenibacillus qinlingensis]MDR6554867.1 multiple sugar transport system substrate-binding protein [Paenibacillus qinlingensis]
MKKVMLTSLTAVISSSILLSGCSSNSGSVASPEASSSASAASSKPVKIKVAYYSDETARATMGNIIKKFMETNKSITVEEIATDWQTHYDNLKVDLAAGQGPTVFLLDGPYIPQYSTEKTIQDLTTYTKDIKLDDYYGFDAIKTPQGKIFGVPQAIQVNALYYNKEMFDKAGVAYPNDNWTTDDVYQAAKKLTDKNSKQFGIGLPQHIRYGWYTVVRQFGGDMLNKERTKSTMVSDPKVKEAFEYMKKFWDESLTPGLKDQEGEISNKYYTWMSRKIVAMFYDNYARRLTNDKEGVKYDVAVVPKSPTGGVNYSAFVANTWVMNAKATEAEKQAGWEFMKYFLGEDAQKLNSTLAEGITANKKVAQAAIADHKGAPEHIKVFLDNMKYAGDLGDNVVWEEWMGAVDPIIKDYLSGKIDINKLLTEGDKAAQAVLDKAKK